jgi:hypothetical protein
MAIGNAMAMGHRDLCESVKALRDRCMDVEKKETEGSTEGADRTG